MTVQFDDWWKEHGLAYEADDTESAIAAYSWAKRAWQAAIASVHVDAQGLAEAVRKVLRIAAIKEMNRPTNLLGEINNVIVDEYGSDDGEGGFDDWWTDYLPKIQAILDEPGIGAALNAVDLAPIIAAHVGAREAEPVAWIRFCSDGRYEGPIMDAAMEDVRKQSGAWTPLYTAPPAPVASVPDGWHELLNEIARYAPEGLCAPTALQGFAIRASQLLASAPSQEDGR
ncbi:hypothetical protein [Crenobacter cavernae]|uniref:Uncharacterized protein n=1 Tax=Crenobacter cavernae TaxID=2290923 RepID=A0ABY0FAH8_9NEIS|nr:hypothetical protein [Crenobacter cavernae]RXZ42657.1 hypothetical protein EBB06_12235 [Crenobacter cavernae]